MIKNENQRLCGGTFFTLLLQARKPRMGVREHYKGTSDKLSDTDTLIALLKVVVPDFMEWTLSMKGTFKGNTSDFKSCKISKSAYLPFGDSAEVSVFDSRIKTEYRKALTAMSGFVIGFIDLGTSAKKDERLVKALLELIDVDETIEDTQPLYINENGSTMTKAALRGVSEIHLQSFLLGIWHFVLVNRKDNTIGKATYDLWCPQNKGAERKYTGTVGCNITRPIKVSSCTEIVEGDIGLGAPKTDSSEESSEQYDESVLSESQASNLKLNTSQTGAKNTQILHAENVTINNNYAKGDKPTDKYYGKVVCLPFVENNNFVGRSEQLGRLHRVFAENNRTTPTTQTIQGLGGIGKTQLALKYAYEHLDEYDTICWVECKTEDSITKACCEFLLVVGESTTEISRFAHWFQNHSNWLLIFDDINEGASVEHLTPKLGNGHIIKTTQIAEGKLVNDLTIPLDKMSLEEAVSFLVIRTNDNDMEAAKAIAVRLDRLPLALEQAAAYINELEIDFAEYTQLLRKHDLKVFDGNDRVKNYNWNVKTVWNITLERLSDAAKQLLYCFAYMSADILALDLLTEHAKALHAENEKPDELVDQIGKDGKPTGVKVNITEVFRTFVSSSFTPELITVFADDLKLNKAVKELKKFSLIKSKNDKTLTMHGLLQEVIRNGITDPVYLLSVAEVMKKRCNEMGLIFDDYHIALPMEQAKSIILNIETLLKYKEGYKASRGKSNIDMWELQFDFYSFIARYLTLRGISEDDIKLLEEADRCFATACEIGLPLYGGGEDSDLFGAHTFTVIQEKHRRMRVNLILNRIDVARKLYAEIRKPVSKVLKHEVHMSFHAFTNLGDLWREFGYYAEAKECYEYVLELSAKDEALTLRKKIAECEKNLAVITNP